MRIIIAFLFVCMYSVFTVAQPINLAQLAQTRIAQSEDVYKLMRKAPWDTPDFSFIGMIQGNTGQPVRLNEAEFVVQGYLYPSVRADVFMTLSRDDAGQLAIGIEEAFMTATNFYDNFGFKLGTKRIEFGKINGLHPEQWGFATRPTVLGTFLADDGLTGEGLSVDYLFPLPFFLQAQIGSWQAPFSDEPGIFSGAFYSARLSSSFALDNNSELSSGLNGVFDNNTSVYGLDMTYVLYPGSSSRLKFLNEVLYSVSNNVKRWGAYSYLVYKFDRYWETGLRFDMSDSLDAENDRSKMLTGVVTHSLTETSKFRVQSSYDLDKKSSETIVQVIFGLGPHSHAIN
jgi:hypothetical protein